MSAPGGIETLLTITGSNFGASQGTGFVEFPNANDGGASYVRPTAVHYISWTDNTIILRVPSNVVLPSGCAGTGNFRVTNTDPATGTSLTPLTIPFTYTNFESGGVVYRADLVNDNGAGGYTFEYNTGFASNAGASAAFQRAIDSWCVTQMNWNVSGTPTPANVIAQDNINIVRFDAGAELPAGVLGRLSSYYSGCGPVGGPFNWYVTEMDVVFDDGINWEYGPALPSFTEYDFESVAVHELGHGHQLNHVIDPNDVMHYAIANSQVRRVPGTDDVIGGNYVSTNSLTPNSCGPTPMVLDPCPLPVRLLSFTGKRVQEGVLLNWSVAEEKDIASYDVARSTDGKLFEVIGSLPAGNSEENNYQFTDPNTFDVIFYRLHIREKDGSTALSKTIRIGNTGMSERVSIYPNPMGTTITLTAEGELLNNAVFTLTASDGRLVKEVSFSGSTGTQDMTVPVADLPTGVYFYRIQTAEGMFTGKLLK